MPAHRWSMKRTVQVILGTAAVLGMASDGLAHAEIISPTPVASTTMAVTLKPEMARDGRVIGKIGVEVRVGRLTVAAGQPIARLALIADNVDTVATVVSNLTIADQDGPVSVQWRDIDLPVEDARDSETGGPTREWYATRAISGPVTIRYSAPAMATLPPRGPAGPLELRNEDQAVSGAGNTFLILPPGKQRYRVSLEWILTRLPAGARGFSSLGEGRSINPSMSPSELRMSYFMAGKVGGWPATPEPRGFFSAWQGQPPFDAAALMRWTSVLHGHYRTFFGQKASDPYGVFLRYNPVNAGGGTGFFRSFVTTYGAGKGGDVNEMKTTLAHEMFHTFQPFITVPAGKASSWFGEGLAVFYEANLPFRYGMIPANVYIEDINFSASRYYSSIKANLPNEAIADGFWKDTRIRTLAYDRGMIYFAIVNEQVRHASGGKRSLDDLMLAMLKRQQAKGSLSNDDWQQVLNQYLGAAGVLGFRRFLAGELQLPSASAFGDCFTRVTKRVRRYEVGFDPALLAEPKRIIRGLVQGSSAERAGLRNGDEIVKPVPQDHIQGAQGMLLVLTIRRGARTFPVSYLPRGDEVNVYQWVPAPSADERCRS